MKKKSRRNSSRKFIYEFDISHKSLKTKSDKKKHSVKIFNEFLSLYKKENLKKDKYYQPITPTSYILKESTDKKHFFYNIVTNPQINHPFSLFGTYNDSIIYIMIPMGNSIGQFDISKIKKEISTLSPIKKLGLYHLLKLTIKLRETNFVKYTKKDIYNCINISECDREVKSLKSKKLLTQDLYNKIQTKYATMVQKSIKNYFNLLKKGKYVIAKDYIINDNINILKKSKKSKSIRNKSKNIKKNICLKNLLYNSKDIIGHLVIFIEVYKCIDIINSTI
tara:strand:- start:298 stop:1134 length:837 start_codon:yes stop_codon:yes gene_type:complete